MSPLLAASALLTIGRARSRGRAGAALLTLTARGLCVILGVRIQSTGATPPAPCLVTPNHWGYVDIVVLASIYRGLFVSRADVARWPVIGFFARGGGTLFLERTEKKDAVRVGDAIAGHLREGFRVTAFPEGGAGRGDVVRPFKSALFEAAVTSGAPCVPVAIRYRLPGDPGADPGTTVAWLDEDFGGHIRRLLALRRIVAEVTFLPPRTGSDRKEMAKRAEEDVRAALAAATPDR